jgi:pyruvate/2-oxoglutarate dehydrogenase complex dihydrolipoamide dehydrogenase (E3) component
MRNYDAIIIGTWQSDPSLARRLAAAGQRVAVIERKLFGLQVSNVLNTAITLDAKLI